jgi:hypothetical protein
MASRKFLVPLSLATLSVDPSIAVTGDLYFNTDSNSIRFYNGFSWIDLKENVEDIVANVLNGITTVDKGISVIYDDTNSSITLDPDDFVITLTGGVTGSGTVTDLSNMTMSTAVTDNSHSHTSSNISDFAEAVQDSAALMITEGTHTNISVSYNDETNTLNFVANPAYDDEMARDAVAAMITSATHSNISVAYDDENNTLAFTAGATYTDEMAQDATASLLNHSDHNNITVTYNDEENKIVLSVPPGTTVSETAPESPDLGETWFNNVDGILYVYDGDFWVEPGNVLSSTDYLLEGSANLYYTDERAMDAIATAISSGTHSNVSISYNDELNSISFSTTGDITSIDSITYPDYITFDNTPETEPSEPGSLWWSADFETLNLQLDAGVDLQIGQEHLIRVKNNSGSVAIPKGTAVMFAGAAGDTVKAAPAVSTADSEPELLIGITAEIITADGFGFVTQFGFINGTNTETPGWSLGNLLYIDPVNPGQLTNVKPSAPNWTFPIAAVTRVHASTGRILVRALPGKHLHDIVDVAISSPADNEVLAYDDSSDTWINKTAGEAGLALSDHNHTLDSLSNVVITEALANKDSIVFDTLTNKWINSQVLPDQLESDGYFLSTNGSNPEWIDISLTYLTSLDALETYLPISTAEETYLTISDAEETYLTILDASTDYAPLVSPSFTTPSLGSATATSINSTTIPTSKTLLITDDIGTSVQGYSSTLAGINTLGSGTGFLKNTAGTWSYDNSTYLTTGNASTTYAPIASPTFTGTVTVPTLNLTSALAISYGGTGATTASDAATALGLGTSSSPTFAGLTINSGNVNAIAVLVKGASGQNSNLQSWRSSSNIELAAIANDGRLYTPAIYAGPGNTGLLRFDISAQNPIVAASLVTTSVSFVAKSRNSQTADIQQWQNSSSTVLAKVDVSGNLTAASIIKSGGTSSQFLKADGSIDSSAYLTSESDPVFTGSEAYTITSTDTSNWDTAYGWGDHSTVGYLTSESDTLETVTDRGATSSNAITITNETASTSATTGALIVTGGVGIGGDIFITGDINLSSDPTQSLHAATKQYVDEIAQGLNVKPSVHSATTENLSADYDNGTDGVGATLTATVDGEWVGTDGVITGWDVFNSILVKDQTNAEENGRYHISDYGSSTTPWVLTRCIYCDTSEEIPGSYIFVTDGDTYAGTGWVAVIDAPATFEIGTDDINYTQFSGAGTIVAGTNIEVDVNEVSVVDAPTFTGTVSAATLNLTNALTYQYGGTGISSVSGQAGKVIAVKSDETGYEFISAGGSSGGISLEDARDEIASLIAAGTNTGITVTYVDDTVNRGSLSIANAGVLTVNGDAGAITNVAKTTDKLSAFASTTSSELATVISDETGTGSLVFSSSPTFTGTVTIPNLSINGNALIESSTGTSSATSTFNTTTHSSAEYIIYASTASGNYVSKVLMLARGTAEPVITEYAILTQGTAPTVTITPSYSAPNAVLTVAVTSGTNIEIIATEISI